jgi:uncharacterized membrane protein YhaH (DUF805 family)
MTLENFGQLLSFENLLLLILLIVTVFVLGFVIVSFFEWLFSLFKKVNSSKLATSLGSATTQSLMASEAFAKARGPALAEQLREVAKPVSPHFSFEGIASRKQFIITQIAIGIFLGVSLCIGVPMCGAWSIVVNFLGLTLIAVSVFLSCWVLWAVSAKRVRDTGVTVWWVLTLLVPPLNLATFVFLLLVPSNEFQGQGL